MPTYLPDRPARRAAVFPERALDAAFEQRTPRSVWERVLRWALVALIALGAAWLLWRFGRLVAYLGVGVLLAYVMRPLVDRFQGVGLAPVPAIGGAFVVVFGLLGILVTYLVPFLTAQVVDLLAQFGSTNPGAVPALERAAASLETWLRAYVPLQPGALETSLEGVVGALFGTDRLANLADSVVSVFTNLFYAVVVVPFVTFFVLKDGTAIRRHLLGLVPNRYFEITLALLEKIESSLGRYFRALLLQCLSVGAVASVLLFVVGLDYALAIGIFAGLANTIPYFGPIIGLLSGSLVGVVQTGDLSLVPGVLIAMVLTQIADNVFFQPYIFSRAAHLHPLIILFVVLIGADVAGIVGMLVAIPLTTTIRVAVQQVRWSLRNYRTLRPAR